MSLTCPRCSHVLEYSGEPPSFCGYCGNRLAQAATADFDPDAETLAPRDGAAAAGPADVPEQVGGYRIVRPLGAGGMGKVYEAEEVATGRRVALKLVAPDFATSAATVERFRQEGRLASAIAHPRCVFVLAADEDAGRPYIVMELMSGDTLETLVQKNGPLPPGQAVARILDVIDGLREAHRLGVVHRDIKPSNCFLEADGRVKVGDFGLAKSLVSHAHLTRTGTFLGTLLYCSPEQVRGDPVDAQSDVYSVAATLYYLLTGKAPFQTGDPAATLARIVADPAPSVRTLQKDVPAALDQVVLRGLERDRQRRWRSLDAFREALLPFVPGRLSIGGVGLRFGAFLLDALILTPVGIPTPVTTLQATAESGHLAGMRAAFAVNFLGRLLYYTLFEGRWGWTVGKRLLRLRVWKAESSEPPGLPRAALRAGIWLVLVWASAVVEYCLVDYHELMVNPVLSLIVTAGALATFGIGVGLMVCTMRARNGYRCLHDVLSGTRVVLLPESERRWTVPTRRLDEGLAPADGVPVRLGGFVVRGMLRRTADELLLLGEAPGLGRQVLLWLRPAGQPPLPPGRRTLSRPTRLRWLAGGQEPDRQWDAFLAPTGCGLADLVAARGRLSWPEFRPLLEQLTDELAAASDDGTLPNPVLPDQVWVRETGDLVLLDRPVRGASAEAAPAPGAAPTGQEVGLLGEVAALALEGKPRPAGTPPRPVRAPVPEHATRLLRRLVPGAPRAYEGPQEVRADLAATRGRPAEVTRARRAGHLTLLVAFLWLLGMPCMLGSPLLSTILGAPGAMIHGYRTDHARADLEQGAYREFVTTELSPSPAARLAGLVQLDADLALRGAAEWRRDHDRRAARARLEGVGWPTNYLLTGSVEPQWDSNFRTIVERQHESLRRAEPQALLQNFRGQAAWRVNEDDSAGNSEPALVATVLVVLGPTAWVLWAFLLRGGLSYRILGLALVRGDGRPAARWQCAWRALLVWAPVTALLVAQVWLAQRYWAGWGAGAPRGALLVLSQAAGWAVLGLLLGYLVLALWHPARALHDRLAGTYLVPR